MSVRQVLLALAVMVGATLLPGVAQAQESDPCAAPVTNPVACENSKPGAPRSEWEIYREGDASLQGFATSMSVTAGSAISLKIDTTAPGYRIDIYRLGYYGGDGARLIASDVNHDTPLEQPECLTDSSTGLIDCGNWAVSATWTVPSTAVTGVYIAKLTRSDDPNAASHIHFVVREDSRNADIAVQTSDATWQAYNDYGGNSLYKCNVACPPGNPRTYKAAFEVSYNRPMNSARTDGGRSFIWHAEYPMIRFLEANGHNVTYLSQIDTERRGELLRNHKVFLSSGHDEYWSANQRASMQAARDAGVNLAFFTGNTGFWKTRYKPSADGTSTPDRNLVSYKDTHFDAPTDPVEWTGTWRDRRFTAPGAEYEPENSLTGLSFLVNLDNSPITVPSAYKDLRLWRNTAVASLSSGDSVTLAPGTLGYEWDEDADNGFRPPGQIRLSSTTVSGVERFQDYGSTVALGTATHNMAMHRASSGALVFNSGTVQWAWGLDDFTPKGNPPDPTMRQATVNLFADMGAQPSTLQSGLTAASQSLDTTAPTATINSPAADATVADGSTVTVTGTATDAGGGVVGGVEVSTDGGGTWHLANGTAKWSYSWNAHGHPFTTIQVRATDDSGNTETPTTGRVVNVSCPCSLWGDGVTPPVADSGDPTSVEVGVKFRSSAYGKITGVRFYKASTNTGTHIGSLWSADGTRLAETTFTNESDSGWQTVKFAKPVEVLPDTTYIASYFAPNGHYSATQAYFYRLPAPGPNGGSSVDAPPLRALRNTGTTTNGVYAYRATSTFPTNTSKASNYWVDVNFEPIPPPGQATNVTATEAGKTSASVSWEAPSTGGAPTSYKITPYIGTTAQTATTITGSPPDTTTTVSGLTNGTTYTFTVQAINPSGAGPESAESNSATPLTAVAPTAPKDVTARPATQSALVSWSPPDSDGDSPITTYTVTPYPDGQALDPVRVPATEISTTVKGLTNGTSYAFRVEAENDVGVGPASEPSAPVTPQNTIFELATPEVVDSQDSGSIELGVKFRAEVTGSVTGVRFYKSEANTGTHTGSLWTADGTRLAQASFTDETATGWQTATFTNPVEITADTMYVVSYFAPRGRYSSTSGALADGVSNPPLHAIANSSSANGVYAYATSSTFPTSSYKATHYGVDLLFAVPKPGQVTGVTATEAGLSSASVSWTPPTTGGAPMSYRITPYDGTTALAPTVVTGSPLPTSAKVSALTTGTTYRFTVEAVNGSGVGPASELSNAVTPTSAVAPGAPRKVVARAATKSALVTWEAPQDDGDSAITSYTITPYVDGSPQTPVTADGSARSVTVTELANGTAYTFTVRATNDVGTGPDSTASGSVTPRYTIFDFTAPATADAGDANLIELGTKFRADDNGAVTGVRFYKSEANTGTHTGSLWTAEGTRLAQATFTDETASGWQTATFSTPVEVTAGTTYVVSYFAPEGHYAATASGLSNSVDNPPLHALANSTSANGVYAYSSTSTFPTASYKASNYWVDVTYAAAPPPGTVTDVTATAGNASATVSWSAPTTGGAPTSYEVIPYVGDSAQPSTTVTGSPPATTTTVTGLTAGTAYTFRVRAINAEGAGPLSSASNSVTPTGASAPSAPSDVTAEADTKSALVRWTAPSDDGGSAITGYSVTPYVRGVAQAPVQVGGSATSLLVTGLTNGTSYVFTVKATNELGTGPESQASNTIVPKSSIFDFSAPAVIDSGDANAIQLGVKFQSSVAGTVSGLRFYKADTNTGTHVGSLWSVTGELLAQATFSGESASGWQRVAFATPVAISADTTYIAGYHAPKGRYSVTSLAFSGPVSNPPLTALASSVSANGVYKYSKTPVFPTSSYRASNYWVDVLFDAGS